MIKAIENMVNSVLLAFAGGDSAKAEKGRSVMLQRAEKHEFIDALNGDGEALEAALAAAYGTGQDSFEVLSTSGEFVPVSLVEGETIGAIVILHLWACPGNKKATGRHAGIYSGTHKGRKFFGVSVKRGKRANVRMALIGNDGVTLSDETGKHYAGFVGEDFLLKADVLGDLGGDADVWAETCNLENERRGKPVHLTLVYQEAGGIYEDAAGYQVQRVSAITLIRRNGAAARLVRELDNLDGVPASRRAFSDKMLATPTKGVRQATADAAAVDDAAAETAESADDLAG